MNISVHKLSDLAHTHILIGLSSPAIGQYPPPGRWILSVGAWRAMEGVNSRFTTTLDATLLEIQDSPIPKNTKKLGLKVFQGKTII